VSACTAVATSTRAHTSVTADPVRREKTHVEALA
jgi:hypothetical protein